MTKKGRQEKGGAFKCRNVTGHFFLLKKGKAEAALRKKEKNVRQKQSKG